MRITKHRVPLDDDRTESKARTLFYYSWLHAVRSTVDFECGSGSPSSTPAPPPPSAATHFDLFDICTYIWCGDGTCQKNGTSYRCDCNVGSGNLFNSSNLACFKPCYLGGDCAGLNISIASPPASPTPPPPPAPTGSAPPRPGLEMLYAVAAGGSALLLMLLR
ncbi:hypothetical protein AKJ16_DCAP03103 [Drosera capensis]